MNNEHDQRKPTKPKEATQRSFEKETEDKQHEANAAAVRERRSVFGKHIDPNSATAPGSFPPGMPAEDAVDPGRSTPNSPPVDNRSGQSDDKDKR